MITQAQIEAARQAILKLREVGHAVSNGALAEAALTAAAEVGEQDRQDWFSARYLDVALKLERNATIERCAQELKRFEQHVFGVGDEYAKGANDALRQSAAAIRALKDS